MYQLGTLQRIFELLQSLSLAILALSGGLLVTACSASLSDPAPSDTNRQLASERMGNAVSDTNLPINKRFATLDDYLAWLRQTQAPVDGPWYEEIRPGVYQLRTGNLRVLGPEGDETPPGQTFSRAQLMKQFGFSK